MDKRISCWNCNRFHRDEGRCKDGKTNPRRKTDAVEVAEVMGVRALCIFSPYRDILAVRLTMPNSEAAREGAAKRRYKNNRISHLEQKPS